MGYQAEKNKIEEKLRRIKTIVLCAVLVALLGLCIFSAFVPPDTWKYHVGKPRVSARKEGELRIHFLDVGQGDCVLIELPDGRVAMIDGGDGKESTETSVLRYLNALKIDVIDHLIVTHADEDHCGSLDKVVEQKKILNAYLPTTEAQKAGEEYAEFYAKILEEDCTKQRAQRYTQLSGEGYTFVFLHPKLAYADTGNGEKDDNQASAILWLDYQGVSTLFTGDAPASVEQTLLLENALGAFDGLNVALDSTEILKVSHHGSADATSVDFLQKLHVKDAIISCGKNNVYGHPSSEVKSNLSKAGANVYRTDESGTIVVTVNALGEYAIA